MAKRVKQCMACKQLTDSISAICPDCAAKKCVNCGKISLSNTQYDDEGRAFCGKCFKIVIANAVSQGRLSKATIESRLETIENDISILKRLVLGKSTAPVSSHMDIAARIDRMIDSELESASPDLDAIRDRAMHDMASQSEDAQSKTEVSPKEDIQDIESK